MTLGEFRKHTANMPDDVELRYHHGGAYFPINTFSVNGNNMLVMVNKNYGEENWVGIVQAMAMLNKQEE